MAQVARAVSSALTLKVHIDVGWCDPESDEALLPDSPLPIPRRSMQSVLAY